MMGSIFFLTALVASSHAMNFLAVGDWGGTEVEPYTTPGQVKTAVGMEKISAQLNAEFILAVGDNFYHEGVIDEYDSRFKSSFENVYTGDHLQVNWYAIAGNHDHNGNVSAQIAYTNDSPRWKFPDYYYTKSFTAEDGTTIDIILIDTVDLASLTLKQEHEQGYFDPLPLKERSEAETQWNWIEDQLKASTADHILVVGHYPVYSVCEHGNTETLVKTLRPMLIQYGAHYLSGHDHCMEHLVEKGTPVNYFLSGMGVECCYLPTYLKKIPSTEELKWYIAADNRPRGTSGGFTSFQLDKSGLTAIFYDQDGNIIYSAPTLPARTK